MIRDDKIIALVAPDKEPITPFVKKVRSLFEEKGVSSILVIGGSGDYFDVADTVVMMSDYQPMHRCDNSRYGYCCKSFRIKAVSAYSS